MEHRIAASLFYGGAWVTLDDTSVHEPSKIKIERGSEDLGELKPGKIEYTLQDPEDRYRPSNPASPLYGRVGRATPAGMAVDGSLRFVAEAASWRPDRTPDFSRNPARGRRWVDLRAEGILRRIGTWSTPLRSPMYRNISGYDNLIGYWPMEDGRDATRITNAAPNGVPGTVRGMVFGEDEAPDGAASTAKYDTNGTDTAMSGKFLRASTVAGWQFAFSVKLAALPASMTQIMAWTTTNGYTWRLNFFGGPALQFRVSDGDGNVLNESNLGFGAGAAPDQWLTFRVRATASAGTVTAELGWYPQGGGVLYGTTDTFAGSVGALEYWRSNGNATTVGGHIAHVFGLTTGDDNLQSATAIKSFNGFVGERAADRFLRLCTEEGISRSVVGSTLDTAEMGRQAPDTFLGLLREIRDTDGCLIYDRPTSLGLTMRTRRDLYNQTPALYLAFPFTVAPPLLEVLDDTGRMNIATVKQRDGGEFTAADLTSTESALPPPAGIGEYKGSLDVSVLDQGQLEQIATWLIANGTVPGARYPEVTVDLDAHRELTDVVAAVELGDRVVIAGRDAEPIELLVAGYTETVERFRRTVTFRCVPGAVHSRIGVYDASRYDSASTTLNGAVTATATSVPIVTTERYEWWGGSWDGTPMPYDVMVAGERWRVTAVTAPVGSGAGPFTQTMTVRRAVNDVTKAHTGGTPVRLADAVRYGL